MTYAEQEDSNMRVRDLVSTRIGYYFHFIEDVKEVIGTNTEKMISRDIVEAKIAEYVDEQVGNLSVEDANDVFIPDYMLEVDLGTPENEIRCAFKFYLTWNKEEQYLEVEYGSRDILES